MKIIPSDEELTGSLVSPEGADRLEVVAVVSAAVLAAGEVVFIVASGSDSTASRR